MGGGGGHRSQTARAFAGGVLYKTELPPPVEVVWGVGGWGLRFGVWGMVQATCNDAYIPVRYAV